MKDTLIDIQTKLKTERYHNEECIRISLVCRILQKLDWDIWNPDKVYAEFKPVPREDNKRLDLALFTIDNPAVFFEIKAVGSITKKDLEEIECQLRNYNRDMSALFCIITDGCKWRFYYPLTEGEFSKKCFKTLDLLSDDPDDVEQALKMFLSKSQIENGKAEEQAKALLKLTRKQRIMEECLPEARRRVLEPPYNISLEEVLLVLVQKKDEKITMAEVQEILRKPPTTPPTEPPLRSSAVGVGGVDMTVFDPEKPIDLAHSKILEAHFGTEKAKNWNTLVAIGVRLAIRKGMSISDLRKAGVVANLRQGRLRDSDREKGFTKVSGTGVLIQGMESKRAWKDALALAKKLDVELRVHVQLQNEKDVILHWKPEAEENK